MTCCSRWISHGGQSLWLPPITTAHHPVEFLRNHRLLPRHRARRGRQKKKKKPPMTPISIVRHHASEPIRSATASHPGMQPDAPVRMNAQYSGGLRVPRCPSFGTALMSGRPRRTSISSADCDQQRQSSDRLHVRAQNRFHAARSNPSAAFGVGAHDTEIMALSTSSRRGWTENGMPHEMLTTNAKAA
jgi:hypothetical protein